LTQLLVDGIDTIVLVKYRRSNAIRSTTNYNQPLSIAIAIGDAPITRC
jgi:hypothetical protein